MIWVGVSTVKLVAGVTPKLTSVAPVRSVPVIVTLVPPPAGPVVGFTLVTIGAAGVVVVVVVVAHTSGGRQAGVDDVVGPPAPTSVAEMPSTWGSACGIVHTVSVSPGPTRVAVVVTDEV